jgi:hypothetical protein
VTDPGFVRRVRSFRERCPAGCRTTVVRVASSQCVDGHRGIADGLALWMPVRESSEPVAYRCGAQPTGAECDGVIGMPPPVRRFLPQQVDGPVQDQPRQAGVGLRTRQRVKSVRPRGRVVVEMRYRCEQVDNLGGWPSVNQGEVQRGTEQVEDCRPLPRWPPVEPGPIGSESPQKPTDIDAGRQWSRTSSANSRTSESGTS